MSNPYAPNPVTPSFGNNAPSVQGPATGLIVISAIAIFFGLLGLAGDLFLVLSGAINKLEEINDGPVSEYTQITIRAVWGVILILASSFVLYGAIQMKNQRNYGIAKAAAIVAMIPLLGPCCLLGIPFGIWALIALGKPGVQESFR